MKGRGFLARKGPCFLNIVVTFASFNSFENSVLIKQLLNFLFNVSEQMFLVDVRNFGNIFGSGCPSWID